MDFSFKDFMVQSESSQSYYLPILSLDSFVMGMNEAFGLGARIQRLSDEEMQKNVQKIMAQKLTKAERIKLPIIHRSNIKIVDEANNLYDLEELKRLIKVRPAQLLQENEKIQHSGGKATKFFNIGLPALKGLAIDEGTNEFVIVDTCPGAGQCKIYCYARKGGYVQWASSSLSASRRINFLLNDPDGFESKLSSEIEKKKGVYDRKNTNMVIRWHDSGDFFSSEYFDLAMKLARRFPDIQFYAYTKMAGVASAGKPSNFIVNFSGGALPEQETQIDFRKVKHSYVVKRDMFSDCVEMVGGVMQYIPSMLVELKQRIADKFGIDVHTILTYEEWKKKPMPLPRVGENIQAGPWNVIVKPGDGDDSASRIDVLGTYLLEH